MDIWPFLPPLALGLDALLGDPRAWPHPVRLIGLALDKVENTARAWAAKGGGVDAAEAGRLRIAGAAVVLLVAGVAGALVYLLCSLPFFGFFIALYFAYAGLALHGLVQEVDRARGEIYLHGAEAGRAAVSGLVSRDVSTAEEADLYRALAETLSENFNDGVVAPFFWLCLGGPSGLWIYKAVSTIDSMWGYKIERWRDLGWAGARLDDLMAWIPARMSALILHIFCPARDAALWPGWGVIAVQAGRMDSPNAGWPMTVAAWAHGRAMGGPTVYHGNIVEKNRLGPEGGGAWNNDSLLALLAQVRKAGLTGCLMFWGIFMLFRIFLD